jgi:hypothetical protein
MSFTEASIRSFFKAEERCQKSGRVVDIDQVLSEFLAEKIGRAESMLNLEVARVH